MRKSIHGSSSLSQTRSRGRGLRRHGGVWERPLRSAIGGHARAARLQRYSRRGRRKIHLEQASARRDRLSRAAPVPRERRHRVDGPGQRHANQGHHAAAGRLPRAEARRRPGADPGLRGRGPRRGRVRPAVVPVRAANREGANDLREGQLQGDALQAVPQLPARPVPAEANRSRRRRQAVPRREPGHSDAEQGGSRPVEQPCAAT